MGNQQRKTSDDLAPDIALSKQKNDDLKRVASDGSPPRLLEFEYGGSDALIRHSSIEFHLTVRLTHSTLSRRDLSLLLEVLCYQCVHFGINLPMYLATFELLSILRGSRKVWEIPEGKICLIVQIAEVILDSIHDREIPLGGKLLLDQDVIDILCPKLMTKRTYGSRFKTWRPEKFFVVRTVPVEYFFGSREKRTRPYDPYCKGYGESHPSARKVGLRPNAETDGDGKSQEQVHSDKLFLACTEFHHLEAASVRIQYGNLHEERKL